MKKEKVYKNVGLIGSIASIIGLILYFFPNNSEPVSPPPTNQVYTISGNLKSAAEDRISNAAVKIVGHQRLTDQSDNEGTFYIKLDTSKVGNLIELQIEHEKYVSYRKKIDLNRSLESNVNLGHILLTEKSPIKKHKKPEVKEQQKEEEKIEVSNSPGAIIVTKTKGDVKISQ